MAKAKVEYKNITFGQLQVTVNLVPLPTWRSRGLIVILLTRYLRSDQLMRYDEIISEGWCYLSPAATGYRTRPCTGIVVRELEACILVDVADWIQVWNSTSNRKSTNCALWRAMGSTPDYVVVGGSFTHSHNKPTADETRGITTIHTLALHNTTPGTQIWTDKGWGAKEEGALWSILSFSVVPTGAFALVTGHTDLPQGLYGLQKH